ncbi:tRNA (adenine(22)-N(1))-methyltransferase [Virgibacillus flavescens]|uniref:tRNA (adenine(22)-N(1))-methyltransferase n=1 Tax=Virgibacillus flavescens TaxID=1611422 RepID=UPI003D3518C8
MNQQLTISNRLKKITSYLEPGSYFADIGSDHAYLPCYVCLRDPMAKAIAGEIVEGPFNSAISTVKSFKMEAAVDVRLGDGLSVLENDEVEQIVIAGMGGSLIKTILANGIEKLGTVNRIIVQPNVDAKAVRKWFYLHNYEITNEEVVEENDHYYEIVVADKKISTIALTEKECMFGPLLLNNRSNAFYEKWKNECVKRKMIINQIEQASTPQVEKLARFTTELAWIKEVIRDGENSHQS